jgi:hypothetical protein
MAKKSIEDRKHWRPHGKTITLLGNINEVLEEYHEYLPLTIRQIFYRLVAEYDPRRQADSAPELRL